MADQILTMHVPLRKGFALIPQLAQEFMKINPKAADLAREMQGAEFSFLLEVDGQAYGLKIRNGREFELTEGIDRPMMRMTLSLQDLARLAIIDNVPILMGQQGNLDKSRYDSLKALNGTVVVHLTNDDGSRCKVKLTFNGAGEPVVAVYMKTADMRSLWTGENNAVSLFMSGAVKLEGDMGVAMALQSFLS